MKRKIIVGASIIIFIITFVAVFTTSYFFRSKVSKQSIVKTDLEIMMERSPGLRCEYTDDKGQSVKAYLKEGKIRMDGSMIFNGRGSLVFKDNKIWTWSSNLKEGFVFDANLLDKAGEFSGGIKTYNEIIRGIDKYRETCKGEDVDDSLFLVPSDLKFKDLSGMIGKN